MHDTTPDGRSLADATKGSHRLQPTVNERVRCILSHVRGPRILHVGCVGHKLPHTAEQWQQHLHFQLCRQFPEARVLGIDIHASGIEEMKKQGFDVEFSDASNLRLLSSFDTIVAGELIEHLSNPGLFLKGSSEALAPGGRLILSTPNVFSIMLALMYWKNHDRAFNPEHSLWLCPQTLREILKRSGFAITELLFVDDLEPQVVRSSFYKVFSATWMLVRPLVPRRYRNTLVAVCEKR